MRCQEGQALTPEKLSSALRRPRRKGFATGQSASLGPLRGSTDETAALGHK